MSQRLTISQYHILEKLYLGSYRLPKDKKFYQSLDKLHKYSLVKKRPLVLTEDGKRLAKDFYRYRYFTSNYDGNILDLNWVGKKSDFNYGKFVADFDLNFVSKIISKHKLNKKYLVLDPFCGTGTSNLASKTLGYKSIGFDINPLNVWGNKIKLDWEISFDKICSEYERLVISYLNLDKNEKKLIAKDSKLREMEGIDKWLNPVAQKDLSYLYYLMARVKSGRVKKLFKFLLGKAALQVSNVEFCPGVSFYMNRGGSILEEFKKVLEGFLGDLSSVEENYEESEFVLGSAMDRKIYEKYYKKVDLIVTSPPYPNNMDYVLMSKLELNLHGMAETKDKLKNLRKKMICSNAKLVNKDRMIVEEVCDLGVIRNIVDLIEIQTRDRNWGFNYIGMMESYFSEMYSVMLNFYDALIRNGTVVMVVGDQTVKGVKIRTAEILAEIAGIIGFKNIEIENYRERKASTHKKTIDEKVLIIRK